MGDDSEWMKLPVNQKCEHKVWKARLHGYQEAVKLFQRIDGAKSPEWDKFQPLIVKLVTDSNAVAQLKGLEAALVYVEHAPVAARTAGEVVSGVICKVFNQPKVRARQLGVDICLMYVEIEKAEAVQESLIIGLDNKNPKIVCGCVETLRRALSEFGSKTVGLKAVVKVLPRLLESREKPVRDEARSLAVEVYRWLGGALRPTLQGLSPLLLRELEEAWAGLPATPATQTRFLRSQQHLRDAALQQQQQGEAEPDQTHGEGQGQCVFDIDPFELLESVEILSKLPKDFHDKIEAKKWQERREALEALQGLVKSPRLEAGDYGDVVRALKKVIGKDTNVLLVALAVNCVSGLASGLRKAFSPYTSHITMTLLEKFKEKKPQVVQALQEAMDAIFLTTSLQSLSEDLLVVMVSKNPSVKQQASLFLARSFRASSPSSLPRSLLKLLFAALIKLVNDSAPEVRDAAFEALGSAMCVLGDKAVNAFLADLEKLKVDKIRESAELCRGKRGGGGGEVERSGPKTLPPAGVPAKTTQASNKALAEVPAKTTQVPKTLPPAGVPAKTIQAPNKAPVDKLAGSHPSTTPSLPSTPSVPSTTASLPSTTHSVPSTTPSVPSTTPSLPSTTASLPSSEEADPRPRAASKAKVHAGKKAAGKAKEEEEESSGPIFILLAGGKELRARDDKDLKTLRWSSSSPRQELIKQLKCHMSPCVSHWLLEQLFHQDFQHHIRAISCMMESLQQEKEAVVSCVDLLFRWFILRFWENNSSILMKVLDFLQVLLPCLTSMQYHLTELEASTFIPQLILKVGESKDGVRKAVRNILSMLCKVYPASKMFLFVMEGACYKNSRQRAECVEELGCLVKVYGLTVCQPSAARCLKDIAVHISDRDACVRNAALNTMLAVYNICGEHIYKMIGHLSDKDMSMLEERIKRSAKKTLTVLPFSSSAALPPKQAPPLHPNISLLQQPASSLRQIQAENAEQQASPHPAEKNQAPPPPAEFSLDLHFLEPNSSPIRELPELYEPSPDHLATPAGLHRTRPLPVCQEELRPSPAHSIQLVISHVASGDLNTSLLALEQVQQALQRPTQMAGWSDQLLLACSVQLHLVCSHLASQSPPRPLLTQLCSRLLDCMFTLLAVSSLACEVSVGVLREVVGELLALLLNPSLEELGPSVLQDANQVLSLLLERTDCTCIISSLLVLMQESLESSPTSKFSEMVMKCLWRVIRFLPDTVGDLDLDQTLLSLHNFMMVFPRERLRSMTSDLPYRTLKTLLHTLYKFTGPKILQHLILVQDRSASDLETHLKMLMKMSAAPRDPSLYRERYEEALNIIFNKITSQENCAQGLYELAWFQKHHADVILTPHLKRLPAPLLTLVEDTLNKKHAAGGLPSLPSVGEEPKSCVYQGSSVRLLQERNIQAPLSLLNGASQLQDPLKTAANKLDNLQRRLQRIKEY